MRQKVLYLAQLKDSSGYSVAARGYFKLLTEMTDEFDVKCVNVSFENKVDNHNWIDSFIIDKPAFADWSDSGFILLWHMPAPTVEMIGRFDKTPNIALFVKELFKKCSKNIQITAWETDRLPKEWLKVYERLKPFKVIVPSEWNKETFAKYIDCDCIPHAVTINTTNTKESRYQTLLKDKFVFLSVSQWSYRKGFDLLLKSYLTEFVNNQDVVLVLKTYVTNMEGNASPTQQSKLIRQYVEKVRNELFYDEKVIQPNIFLVTNMLAEDHLNDLYESSDVYVTTTRGEGFGLTIAEASYKGLPVIAPNKGGHVDFLGDDYYKIESHSTPCVNMPSYSSLGNFFEPSITSCKSKMREVYELQDNNKSFKKPTKHTEKFLQHSGIKELLKKAIKN